MGVRHIATFVPWQALESDISHALPRFLLAAAERKLEVSLIVSPEVGVHYPNSGMPRDLLSKKEDLAQDFRSTPVACGLPPNRFNLPSLFCPDFNKRYYSFLARIDGLLGELGRQQPAIVEGVTIVLSGSYWKYNRSPLDSARSAFAGQAGDYSGAATIAFRQRAERYFEHREFQDPHPAAAASWRARGMDEINRRWFYQHSEDVFRNRSYHLVRRRASFLKVREIELFTPEADPGYAYSHFLQTLAGGNGDLNRLSGLVDEASTRTTTGAEMPAAPFVHWCSFGGFHSLSDPEKQFLILKSLLLMGARGGGVLLDESEWFAFSQAFRARAEGIARLLSKRELLLRTRALYLAGHAWSSADVLWDELHRQAGQNARVATSIDLVARDTDAKMVVVDPSIIITREMMQKLTQWLSRGGLLVLPRSPYFTESARSELEALIAHSRRLEVDLGVPYQLHVVGSGKLVLYDVQEKNVAAAAESRQSWKTFIAGMLSVADIETPCRLSDSRMRVIALDRATEGRIGLFVLNETTRQVSGDVIFSRPVEVSDFAHAFSAARAPRVAGSAPMVSSRFSLESAPCGVLSLAVEQVAPSKQFPHVTAPEPFKPAAELPVGST
ncbi:MAG: hypothetical protein A2X94_17000 [Bdellovibrionales bacterium GWB1_55_8]|nr:MAG: hypothetical protein A2X94_17000 [Bdellovibrionales bacterium GWB1_55_8]